jgi:hypothetical protein
MIAYPNGRHDERVVAIARAEGLTSGVAVRNAKARLPLDPGEVMTLPRVFLRGGPSIVEQCILSRSDLRPLAAMRSLLTRTVP